MATASDERELFVKAIGHFLKPVVGRLVAEGLAAEHESGIERPIEEFIGDIHHKLLGQLYDFGQTEIKFQVVLMPLMAHLRKIEKAGKI